MEGLYTRNSTPFWGDHSRSSWIIGNSETRDSPAGYDEVSPVQSPQVGLQLLRLDSDYCSNRSLTRNSPRRKEPAVH